MKGRLLILLILFFGRVMAQSNPETYPVDPASEEQAGVPKGEILKFTFTNSTIFPGTSREISIYIPEQYKADKPDPAHQCSGNSEDETHPESLYL